VLVQLALRKRPVVPGEQGQEIERLGRQPHVCAIAEQLTAFGIERPWAKTQRHGGKLSES
jgi:hypothetical protein